MTPVTATAGIRGRTAAAVTRLRVAYCGCQLLFNCPVFNEARGFGSLIRLPRSPSKPGSPPYQQHYATIVYHDGGECASERRRGRVSGRGAVGRCADLVPNEKVKSVIRETIAERRCQAVCSWVRERGKRAALSGGSRSGAGAVTSERSAGGRAARCSRAMRGPRTPRKSKVRHPRHDCGAALSGGSQSGAGAGQASGGAAG